MLIKILLKTPKISRISSVGSWGLFIGILILVIVGCSDREAKRDSKSALGQTLASPNMNLPVASAKATLPPKLEFSIPTLRRGPEEQEQMLALYTGELIRDADCLKIKAVDGFVDSYVLVWPNGYSAYTHNDHISVRDAEGSTVVSVGDLIAVGGGEVAQLAADAPDVLGLDVTRCPGPYWIVSKVQQSVR